MQWLPVKVINRNTHFKNTLSQELMQPPSQGLSSLPQEAQKRDPGAEVGAHERVPWPKSQLFPD